MVVQIIFYLCIFIKLAKMLRVLLVALVVCVFLELALADPSSWRERMPFGDRYVGSASSARRLQKQFKLASTATVSTSTASTTTTPFIISGGRPRLYFPGCFVPVLDVVFEAFANVPGCPKHTTVTIGLSGYPDTSGVLTDQCIANILPTASNPVPPRGVRILPHAQGSFATVKNDLPRLAYFNKMGTRGYTENVNFRVLGYNFFLAPYQIVQNSNAVADLKAQVALLRHANGNQLVDIDAHSCGPQYLSKILAAIEVATPGWTKANIARINKLSDDTFGESDIWIAAADNNALGFVYVSDPVLDLQLINSNPTIACFFTNFNVSAETPFISTPGSGIVKVKNLPPLLAAAGRAGFASNWVNCANKQVLTYDGVTSTWMFPTNGIEPVFYTYSTNDITQDPADITFGPGDDEQNTATNSAGVVFFASIINQQIAPVTGLTVRSNPNTQLPAGVTDHHTAQISDDASLNYRALEGNTPVDD